LEGWKIRDVTEGWKNRYATEGCMVLLREGRAKMILMDGRAEIEPTRDRKSKNISEGWKIKDCTK